MNDPFKPTPKPSPPLRPRPMPSPRPSSPEVQALVDETPEQTAERHRREGTTSPGLKLPKLEAQLNKLRSAEETKVKQQRQLRPIKFSVSFVGAGALLATVWGLWHHTEQKGDAVNVQTVQLAEQVKQVKEANEKLEAKVEKANIDRAKDNAKLDSKLELLLDAAHVPQSKRPKEEDP